MSSVKETHRLPTNPFEQTDRSILPSVPRPHVPDYKGRRGLVRDFLREVQDFIDALEYNHTLHTYFNLNKFRNVSRILETGKEIARECLPIKCLEAVFLSLYLTQDCPGVERIPLSLTSHWEGHEYRHVVCCTWDGDQQFGALGISRRKELAYKPMHYRSLADLVFEFADSYAKYGHQLLRIHLGLPVTHEWCCMDPLCWRILSLSTRAATAGSAAARARLADTLRAFVERIPQLRTRWQANRFVKLARKQFPPGLLHDDEEECTSGDEDSG